MAIALSGCQTPQSSASARESPTNASREPSPFLEREQYSDRLGLAIDYSLRNHRFTRPWIVVKGSEGAVWFVAERFHSEHKFDRIYVQVKPGPCVTASITPYEFYASDWAILGKMVVGDTYRLEAEAIAGEITFGLNESQK